MAAGLARVIHHIFLMSILAVAMACSMSLCGYVCGCDGIKFSCFYGYREFGALVEW